MLLLDSSCVHHVASLARRAKGGTGGSETLLANNPDVENEDCGTGEGRLGYELAEARRPAVREADMCVRCVVLSRGAPR